MSHRGRTELVYESDDSSGYYEVPAPPPKQHRSRSRIGIRVVEDKYDAQPVRKKVYQHSSYNDGASSRGRESENLIIHNHLSVPKGRPRASSTGGSPAPNYIPVYLPSPEREVSRERRTWHKEKRTEYYSSDEDDSDYGRHGRRRSRRRSSRERNSIKAELAELARLRQDLNKKDPASDPAIARQLAQLKIYEEEKREQEREQRYLDLLNKQKKRDSPPPEYAKKLARLEAIEREREEEEREAAFMAQIEEKKRKEKQREEELRYKYDEAARKQKEAEKEAVARAEAARAKAEAEAEAEHKRIVAEEREKAAKASAKEKAEAARILAEAKAKAAEEKAERERFLMEEKARAAKEKKEDEDLRKRILAEEEDRKEKEKKEKEEVRLQVLAEEKARIEKEKAKKKEEDAAFDMKMREKLMNQGFMPDYIDDILEEEKSKDGRRTSTSRANTNQLALTAARPTYIRVQIKHLLPETLNHFNLPWEHDPKDERYVLIKEYIDHDFQQVLFQHTKRIYKHRETHMLEGAYTKETVTTLRPEVYKDKDEMYLVRRKSTGKSPSRPGRKWMFT